MLVNRHSTAGYRRANAIAQNRLGRDARGLQGTADDPGITLTAQAAIGCRERAGEGLNTEIEAAREIHGSCDFELLARAG